jgi:long-chain fatty acid transport protein
METGEGADPRTRVAAYLYIPTTKINNRTRPPPNLGSAATNHGTVTGDYDSSVWILGAQYSLAF